MSEKTYSAKRWTDIPEPRVIGKVEYTKEEIEKHNENLEKLLKKYSVLKKNESIKEGKYSK